MHHLLYRIRDDAEEDRAARNQGTRLQGESDRDSEHASLCVPVHPFVQLRTAGRLLAHHHDRYGARAGRGDGGYSARIFPNSGITILSNVFNNTTHIIEKFAVWSM